MRPFRDVVESPRFTREKLVIEPDVRRMDEALDDLVWTLARRPELGVPFADTALWAYPVYIREEAGASSSTTASTRNNHSRVDRPRKRVVLTVVRTGRGTLRVPGQTRRSAPTAEGTVDDSVTTPTSPAASRGSWT